MQTKSLFSALFVAGMLSVSAQAQVLGALTVTPLQAKVGEPVTVSATIDVVGGNYCGFVIGFGDGTTRDGVSDVSNATPLVVSHTYDKPGGYHVTLGGRNVQNHPNCGGQERAVDITVTGTAQAAAKPGKLAAPTCPDGWKLVAKSTNAKTGAYACSAKPGTALPATKPECRGDLTYYENGKKGQLGCKP